MMKKIGIVGCGTIGRFIAKRIERDFKDSARIVGLCDIDTEKAKELKQKLSMKIPVLSLERLIDRSDLIIEAASCDASPIVCKKALKRSKDVMVLSIGGLLNKRELFSLARKKSRRIILPSGAICGLDGLKSARCGRIRKVILTTRKPPEALRGAPYIVNNNIDLDSITGEQVIFDGTAQEAVRGFPKNINISALVSLAGIGPRRTRVKIITSAEFMVNMHEIEVEGDFGRLITRTENVPFPENPKTSYLAALSAIATLREVIETP